MTARAAMVAGRIGGLVTLSGETIEDRGGSGRTAGIRFNTDGTVDKRERNDYTQIDVATDWIIPNVAATSEYEVRFTGHTGDPFTELAAAENIWIAISTAREWKLVNGSGGSTDTANATFEIRRGSSGAAMDTGAYVFIAEVF